MSKKKKRKKKVERHSYTSGYRCGGSLSKKVWVCKGGYQERRDDRKRGSGVLLVVARKIQEMREGGRYTLDVTYMGGETQ